MKLAALLLPLQALGLVSQANYFYNTHVPLVICNQGCSGHYPENTAAAYTDAFLSGADFVSITVHATQDGVLVVNEDVCLKQSTNVKTTWGKSSRFPQATQALHINNQTVCSNDWVIPQLKWNGVQSMKRVQRYPQRNRNNNGIFSVMSLNQTLSFILDLPAQNPASTNTMGLSIQIDYADWYNSTNNFDIVNETFNMLRDFNLSTVNSSSAARVPIMIQSSDLSTLRAFAALTDLPLVQTVFSNTTYDYTEIAEVASAVRPELDLIFTEGGSITEDDSDFIKLMHTMELAVHPATLIGDREQIGLNSVEALKMVTHKGADGVYADFASGTKRAFNLYGTKSKLYDGSSFKSIVVAQEVES